MYSKKEGEGNCVEEKERKEEYVWPRERKKSMCCVAIE